MTPAAFLKLALTLPEVTEGKHQGGADLRVVCAAQTVADVASESGPD